MAKVISRRSLLKRTAALAGAAVGSRVFGPPLIWSGEAPNSKLGCAVIGCGGRGMTSHLPEAVKERLVALVDVDEKQFAKCTKFIESKFKALKLPSFKTYTDYRKMFDECGKDIDAVFVATPNHHHALPAMIAMKLGKGAYVEKPMCHTIQEARAMAKMAEETKAPTQMGNQGHCAEGYRRFCEYIWAGAIGNVTEVHCWSDRANGGTGPRPPKLPVPEGMHWDEWIGPAPYRDFHKDLHPHEWHNWYDFGNGSLGNMACHVMDGAVWALKLQWPTSVTLEMVLGGTDEYYPIGDRICYDFPARGDMPPVKVYWWDGRRPNKGGQNRPPIAEELEKKYERKFGGNGTIYIGDKGVMQTGCYGEGARILPEEKHKAFPAPPQTLPRNKGSFNDFLGACRSGKPTTASKFEVAVLLTEIVLLGNLAQKAGVGKKVEWDGPNMKCTNIPEVNKIVEIPSRKGWTV